MTSTRKRHGCNQLALLKRGDPTHALRAFSTFKRLEALPNFAVAVGVIVSIINACFIHINNLPNCFCLQPLLELLPLEFIPFSIAVGLFLRVRLSFCRASLMFCCVTPSPHNCAICACVLPPCSLTNASKRSQSVILCPHPFWK